MLCGGARKSAAGHECFARRSLKERIIRFFKRHRRDWPVAGTQQSLVRQGEDLFADFLLEEIGGLFSAGQ